MKHHVILIPQNMCKDFIGTVGLDILHDSKSRSTLYGAKLAQITDLLATSFILHNEHLKLDETAVNIYFFKLTLEYFCRELWEYNLSAFGLYEQPDFEEKSNEYWNEMRERVIIPFHNIADRFTECNFASLGNKRSSAESYNYKHQKDKLDFEHYQFISFESPRGLRKPEDFITLQRGIIDIIKDRMGDARVVLDMKSAAGLLRSITDAIGYINNIATNSDPGRDMPGMKAIRQYAHTTAVEKEFEFRVEMETPFSSEPCVLLDISYIYEDSVVKRANITILDNIFKARLPRSVDMSEALNQYLFPKPTDTVVTLQDIVQKVYFAIEELHKPKSFAGDAVLQRLHNKGSLTRVELFEWLCGTHIDAADVYRVVKWILTAPVVEQWVRIVYILDTIKNIECYGVTPDSVIPLRIIEDIKTEFTHFKNGERDFRTLGYCHHQIQLLQNYTLHPENSEKWAVIDAVTWARIPGKRGSWCNLTTQLDEQWELALNFKKLYPFRNYTDAYFEQFLTVCQKNLSNFVQIDQNGQTFYENVLCRLPTFNGPSELTKELEKRMLLLRPELYKIYNGHTELVLNEFLAICETLINIRFNRPFIWRQTPPAEEAKMMALYQTLGKFSGDFGQIIWSLFHEQIFATEDNNASAMALLIQRLPISEGKRWATIHGLGDGTAVDITMKK